MNHRLYLQWIVYSTLIGMAVGCKQFSLFSSLTEKFNTWGSQVKHQVESIVPFLEDKDEDERLIAKVWPGISSVGTTLYGTALVLVGHELPNQIHVITMMRATGFDKIETGIRLAKENLRQAIQSAVWHAPSFVMAAQSLLHLQDRVGEARAAIATARKARDDGIVTQQEWQDIRRKQKKVIRNLQRDMKRIAKAGQSLSTFFRVLDVDEIVDVAKGFMFQLMAVLATGHNSGRVGRFMCRYCLSLNLGSLFLDMNGRMDYPIARYIITKKVFSKDLGEKKEKLIRNVGRFIVYTTSAYLSFYRTTLASRLNTAFITAAVAVRGVRSLANTLWDRKHDHHRKGESAEIWGQIATGLEGKAGGLVMLALVISGITAQSASEKWGLFLPRLVVAPLKKVDNAVDQLAVIVDKVV